jgi:hypothetical protein
MPAASHRSKLQWPYAAFFPFLTYLRPPRSLSGRDPIMIAGFDVPGHSRKCSQPYVSHKP